MNICDLLKTNKPLHPVELDQSGLRYGCRFASLECYWIGDVMYAFVDAKREPFLNHYHTYNEQSEER